METKYGFHLMDIDEFAKWLTECRINRIISLFQNHHTYLPDYSHFNGRNYFERLQSMKHYHMVNNGWSNIAQNLTTFPDGKIAVCRPLNDVPVGIKGQNSRGICIEHFGNFDAGKDQMNPIHAETIVALNALLCNKFSIPADTDHIVYHHWFDLNKGIRLDGKGVTKSCPGTAFFGGNSVEAANENFIPLVKTRLHEFQEGSAKDEAFQTPKPIGTGVVLASTLNLRKGPGTAFAVSSTLSAGAMISIFEQKNGWIKAGINNEWVYDKYVVRVIKARVMAGNLNVRTGPDKSFPKLTSLPLDTEVLVYQQADGWSKIDINDKWVSSAHLEFK